MPIEFTCPSCGAQTNVADQYAGQTGPCAKCGHQITIPGTPVDPGATYVAPPRKRSSSAWIIVLVVGGSLGMLVVCGGILVALMLPAIQAARGAAQQVRCMNNMKQIALALQCYNNDHGQYPPAYIADENGRPMHSWRVLILPYLEQSHVYDQYNFDEPWDSPNNRAATSMAWGDIFQCPSNPSQDSTKTNYVMIVGPGCFSEGPKGRFADSIKDGTSNTIMIAEIANSDIDWAEPRDLDATTMSYVVNDPSGQPSISSNHPAKANVAMADGSVKYLENDTDPQVVIQMTQVNDGGPAAHEMPQ